MRLLIVLFLCSTALAWEHETWLNEVENRFDEDAISWFRKQINPKGEMQAEISVDADCKSCFKGKIHEVDEPKLFIFMSFSVPENIWLSLSQEMKGKQAVFVLRGLPQNSFKLFAQKIGHLKEKGMEASVQIHPNLFNEYSVDRVPTFVLTKHPVSKVSGVVSLKYANDLLSREREKLE